MFDEMNPNFSNPMNLFTHMRDNDPMRRIRSLVENAGMGDELLRGNPDLEEIRRRVSLLSDEDKMKLMTH